VRDLAGVVPTRGWVRASLEVVEDAVVEELGVDEGAQLWFVESLNLDGPGGTPVYLSRRWIRADAAQVVVEAS
jgi:DNA-binding GntR family transcriptional regulator